MQSTRLEVEKCARILELIPTEDNPDININPALLHDPRSPKSEVDAEAEGQRLEILANVDTWYDSQDAVVRPVLLKYKIPQILSMSAFFTTLEGWCGAAAQEPKNRR